MPGGQAALPPPGRAAPGTISMRLDFPIVDLSSFTVHPFYQITEDPAYANAKAVSTGMLDFHTRETDGGAGPLPRLLHALPPFGVEWVTAIDLGASTGGFTDCLLQRGAAKVYAVDVGQGQLAWKLRQDPRVVTIERVNIRDMSPTLVAEPVDIAVIDVSFISLEKVIPAILNCMKVDSEIIALIKPQFEVGRENVGKGGIVRDEAARNAAVKRVEDFIRSLGLEVKGIIQSPITGQDGNVEFLIHAVKHE